MDDVDADSAEVVEALSTGLERSGANKETLERFNSVKAAFAALLDSQTLYVSAKATQLFAADSLHLHEIKVYSDCRPVFDRDRTSVRAMLLFNTLSMIASNSREEEVSFSVTLKREDLERLARECQRALAKTVALEKALEGSAGGEIIVYGNERR
jgi:hypothetical protein